ncbi:MAG: hypothetical protein ACFFDS_03030 [Candidatus Thorarchaeota archaeon]
MKEGSTELKSPANIELSSLKDLIKLVISSVGPDRAAGYIGFYKDGGRAIYFIFNTSIGYYELTALPIVVWVEEDEQPKGSFIRYRTSPVEEIEFTEDASDPKWLNIPLVNFKKMPDFLRVWEK